MSGAESLMARTVAWPVSSRVIVAGGTGAGGTPCCRAWARTSPTASAAIAATVRKNRPGGSSCSFTWKSIQCRRSGRRDDECDDNRYGALHGRHRNFHAQDHATYSAAGPGHDPRAPDAHPPVVPPDLDLLLFLLHHDDAVRDR